MTTANSSDYNLRQAQVLAATATHTFAVRWTKSLLGIGVLVLLLTIPLLPYMHSSSTQRFTMALDFGKDAETEKPIMVNPKLQGVDNKNQPYNVTADRAIQEEENLIRLEKVNGDLLRQTGQWLSVVSEKGTLQSKAGLLDLEGKVNLFTDDGFQMRTEAMKINLKENSAESVVPVETQGNTAIITSDRFHLTDGGKKITFLQNVHMLYYPRRAQ